VFFACLACPAGACCPLSCPLISLACSEPHPPCPFAPSPTAAGARRERAPRRGHARRGGAF
jgi:hypothetical protein